MPIVKIADNLLGKGFESNEKLICLIDLEKSPGKKRRQEKTFFIQEFLKGVDNTSVLVYILPGGN